MFTNTRIQPRSPYFFNSWVAVKYLTEELSHVCMHVCIYIYLYLHIYISISIYVCMFVCMQVCMYVCMHACIHIYVYMYHNSYTDREWHLCGLMLADATRLPFRDAGFDLYTHTHPYMLNTRNEETNTVFYS